MDVVVGRVGRARGLAGEVTVQPRTDQPERRFVAGAVLRTDPAAAGPLTVTAVRGHGDRLVVRFAEVSDRSGAERLAGTLLVLDVDEAERPADPDEYYDHQLVGLTVETAVGQSLGEVSGVLHLPMQDVLAVRDRAGGEFLVPLVKELVPVVDLDRARVVVEPPAGLLDPEGAGGYDGEGRPR